MTGPQIDRVTRPRSRTVSPEFIEKLRNMGASDSTIRFAERFVTKDARPSLARRVLARLRRSDGGR
jgi:hypothetical protein